MPPIALRSPTRPSTAHPAAFTLRGVAALRVGIGRLLLRREFAATFHTLDRLDDHTLRDIGLRRGDIAAGVRRRLDR